MGDIPCDDNSAGETEPSLDLKAGQGLFELVHALIEVDFDDFALKMIVGDVGDVLVWFGLELLQPNAVFVDLAVRLSVRRAGDAHAHRAGRAVPRQTDHAHVVAEVLPTELSTDPHPLS